MKNFHLWSTKYQSVVSSCNTDQLVFDYIVVKLKDSFIEEVIEYEIERNR